LPNFERFRLVLFEFEFFPELIAGKIGILTPNFYPNGWEVQTAGDALRASPAV
jgi:hypothetical protein